MYNLFSKFRDYLVYREAVRLADAQHEKNHSRYYVVPSKSGKLMVVDRKNFRILKGCDKVVCKAVALNEKIAEKPAKPAKEKKSKK